MRPYRLYCVQTASPPGPSSPRGRKCSSSSTGEFPQTLRLVQADLAHADATHLRFELWKPVGDELIFTCELRQETDVFEAIAVWTDTMAEYKRKSLNGEVLKETGGLKLGVKGGAFIATFPGPDSESSIPRRPDVETSGRDVVALNREALLKKHNKRMHTDYMFDYFGPSIDTGFRVLSLCSARHFAVSLEVAFVLSSLDQMSTAKPYKSSNLTLLRGAELRGVWGGRRYPVFALDLEAGDPINQAFRPFEQPSGPDQRHPEALRVLLHKRRLAVPGLPTRLGIFWSFQRSP